MKMVSLLKSINKQPYLNMFKKKRNNKGVMWASLISIGVSALMMMLSKGKRRNIASSLQSFTKNMAKNSIPMMKNTALTEFSEEFQSKNMQAPRDTDKHHDEGLTEFSKELSAKELPASGEISNMDDAALTNFSEELLSKAIENK